MQLAMSMPALHYAELQGPRGGPVTAHQHHPLSHRWWWHHDLPKGPGKARNFSRFISTYCMLLMLQMSHFQKMIQPSTFD